jgi:hypothetical protein
MTGPDDVDSMPVDDRRVIYSALVDARDQLMAAAQAHSAISQWFGVSADQVRSIEQEGVANEWPPL